MSKALTKDDIFKATDIDTKEYPVPEWGGHVYIKMLSAKQREDFEDMVARAQESKQRVVHFRAKLCSAMVCDSEGNLLFPTPADVKALSEKNGSVLDRICSVCMEFNGMTEAAAKELEKNSDKTQE